MNKKRIVSILLTFIILSSPFPLYAQEKNEEQDEQHDLAPDAQSAIVIERDTGQLLFEKDANTKRPPASMTKVMTLLLIMEAIENEELSLDETIRISENAASMGGSQIFLGAGEEMSVHDLLKGIAIASGNDASVALAERISGSEEAFVKEMNDKVTELGLENTYFQNASGLPADNHYSTSYDMAMIAKELLKYETITDYTSIYDDYLRKGEENEFWLVNTNKLVKFYPGVDGLKTGYTNEAKYCLTATAMKDDMRVIAVVMGADTIKERNASVSSLLDYAYNHFETQKLFEKGENIRDVELFKAEDSQVEMVASQSISTIHKKGESTDDLEVTVNLDNNYELPMKKGTQTGTIIVKNDGEVISETPIVTKQNVEKASYMTLFKRTMQSLAKYR